MKDFIETKNHNMNSIIKNTSLLIISIVTLLSCRVDISQNDKIKGNKKVTTQDRIVNASFSKIEIKQGITAYITYSDKEKITVETDENLHDAIQTEISKGTLKIYSKKNISKSKARNVYISIKELSSIESNSGSRVISENTILGESIHIESQSGSSISLQVIAKNIHATTSSGSTIKLKGSTNFLEATSSSGSFIKAYDLKAINSKSVASSGSHIKITTTNELKAKANSGSLIKYKGNPVKVDKKAVSSGKVIAK